MTPLLASVLLHRLFRPTVTLASVLAVVPIPVVAEDEPSGPFARLYAAEQPTFEVDQMFGGDIEDEDSFLYAPVDLALDTDGNLYVLDAKEKVVKKFDADGNHLLTFSRPGQGPGDLESPTSISITPEGTVLVYDWRLRRFTTFARDGTYMDSIEYHEMGSQWIDGIDVDSRGRIYANINVQDQSKPEAPIPFRLCRLELDPYRETRIDSAAVAVTLTVTHGEGTMYTGIPGAPAFLWALTPDDGVVVGSPSTVGCDSTPPTRST